MLGPIPNSLGAGAYNGSFMPHGLVTFSSRGSIVKVFQEVCLNAIIHPSADVFADLHTMISMMARLDSELPLTAVLHTDVATDATLHDTLAFDAVIEECS